MDLIVPSLSLPLLGNNFSAVSPFLGGSSPFTSSTLRHNPFPPTTARSIRRDSRGAPVIPRKSRRGRPLCSLRGRAGASDSGGDVVAIGDKRRRPLVPWRAPPTRARERFSPSSYEGREGEGREGGSQKRMKGGKTPCGPLKRVATCRPSNFPSRPSTPSPGVFVLLAPFQEPLPCPFFVGSSSARVLLIRSRLGEDEPLLLAQKLQYDESEAAVRRLNFPLRWLVLKGILWRWRLGNGLGRTKYSTLRLLTEIDLTDIRHALLLFTTRAVLLSLCNKKNPIPRDLLGRSNKLPPKRAVKVRSFLRSSPLDQRPNWNFISASSRATVRKRTGQGATKCPAQNDIPFAESALHPRCNSQKGINKLLLSNFCPRNEYSVTNLNDKNANVQDQTIWMIYMNKLGTNTHPFLVII